MSSKTKFLAVLFVLVVAVAALTTLLLVMDINRPTPKWPAKQPPENVHEIVSARRAQLAEAPVSYENYIKDHSAFGDYLNLGIGTCLPRDGLPADDRGVLMREYGGKPYYHPVLTAQCGLKAYGRYLRKKEGLSEVILYADVLLDLQNEAGGFAYPFAYPYYLTGEDLPPGWTSGMAQGQGMSLLARAFSATGDERYLEAGRSALSNLITPVDRGGLMVTLEELDETLSDFIFFEEYVSSPNNYTLNGYIFALLGLYDWSQIPPETVADQETARTNFQRGTDTLRHLVSYYDMEGATAYDLGYITFGPDRINISNRYHGVHIYLMNAMHSITGIQVFKEYQLKWEAYAHSGE